MVFFWWPNKSLGCDLDGLVFGLCEVPCESTRRQSTLVPVTSNGFESNECPVHEQHDEQQNQKGTKLRQDRPLEVDEASLEKDQSGQLDHVPVVLSLVLQNIEGPGDVAVAIVAENIVHPLAVDLVGVSNGLVPAIRPTVWHRRSVHLEVPGRSPKGHDRDRARSIGRNRVGSPKIVGSASAVGNAEVTDEREYSRDGVEG